MRKRYSEDLLKDIHIRLDKRGLEGLTEKEMMVLLSEDIVLLSEDIAESTEYLGEYLGGKIDQSTAQILDKIDQTVTPLHFWAKVIGSGLWAVAASLIASIIFRACGG
ncbi:hypothetical protein HYR99_21270 [Candidatus Poribacteria bacterium]|nr:hypothetical protein [Candidatus Poribacteria bacterium]